MHLMRYRFIISNLPGKHRQTVSASKSNYVLNIQHHQEEDEICQRIVTYCKTDWPTLSELPHTIKPYYLVASELSVVHISVVHSLLMRGTRIVIQQLCMSRC